MFLLKLIAALPSSCLSLLAVILYGLSWPFAGKDRAIIQSNIQRVYGLPPHSSFSRQFVRQNLLCQAKIMLETIKYVFFPRGLEISGLDEARSKLEHAARDVGVVIIAAHHGSWELAGHAAGLGLKRPFYVLAKPSKSKWLDPILDQIRERLGMKVLWTDSKTLLRDMMAVSQRGEGLGFVMDQRPGKRQGGHPCVFLGVPDTNIVPGPVLMASRKNMPVFGVYMMRVGPCRYRFILTDVLPPGHGETDEKKIAQKMADDMSAMIRMYPEQWSWNYRRWK